jgi:hypothetical protein
MYGSRPAADAESRFFRKNGNIAVIVQEKIMFIDRDGHRLYTMR